MNFFVNHAYRYAVEQLLLQLFPGEKPVCLSAPPAPGEDGAVSRLFQAERWVTATARLTWKGRTYRKRCRAGVESLAGGVLQERRVKQYLVRTALYRAAVEALGAPPPWGSLTGVRPVKLPVGAILSGKTQAQAAQELRRRYDVSPERIRLTMDCARACLGVKSALAPRDISLYIGIPFCPTRCAYCSFISADVQHCLKLVEPYVATLVREIAAAGAMAAGAGLQVRSVYMGGGTPTTLSAGQLDAVLEAVEKAFDFSRCIEYTVEAGRPDTITKEKLAVLRGHGVTRVSVNPQTMDDAVLRAIGRDHTAAQTLAAWELVRQAGFAGGNMDLIAGLPADTAAGFAHTLDTVLSLAPENITVHTLALKKGARLKLEQLPMPSGEAVGEMLALAGDRLTQRGYRPYYLYRQKYMSGGFENVGWCLPGQESVYNICMMEELHSVLALGCGGVSKLLYPDTRRIQRLANPKYPYEYIRRIDGIVRAKGEMLPLFQAVLPER